jgi:hypothetical protein
MWREKKLRESTEEQIKNFNKIDQFIILFTDKVLVNYSQSIDRSSQNSFVHGVSSRFVT